MKRFLLKVKDGRPRWRDIFKAIGAPEVSGTKGPGPVTTITFAAGPGRPQLNSELGAWDRLHGESWIIQRLNFSDAIQIATKKGKRLNVWCSRPLMLKRPALNDNSCEHEILFAWTVNLLFLDIEHCTLADLRELYTSIAGDILESTKLYWVEFELQGQTVCIKCPPNREWQPHAFKWPNFE